MDSSFSQQSVHSFSEDREDAAKRAIPRLLVGNSVMLGLLCAVATSVEGTPSLSTIGPVAMAVWAVLLLSRLDVLFLQWGRKIQYVVNDSSLTVLRSGKEVVVVEFETVRRWWSAEAVGTVAYWLGLGYFRSAFFYPVIPKYGFEVERNGRTKVVNPPALFRWRDRGGLRDVEDALIQRLGLPENGRS